MNAPLPRLDPGLLEPLARRENPPTDLPLDPGLPPALGNYQILARLGEGATSEVLLGLDRFRQQQVAIKRLRPHRLLDGAERRYAERFFAVEATLVGRLQHPNLVRLLDAFESPEGPCLVMEYVPGVTLRHFCDPGRLLSLEQVVEVGFKCAMALGHLWQHGLIHRDVKPANILVSTDGPDVVAVKVTDFGSMLNLWADVTQVHRVGTLAYIAPEQLEGDPLDCRSDIYALAAVMHHLVAGRPPFDGATQAEMLRRVVSEPAPSLLGVRPGVTPALDDCLHRALSKDRRERHGSWEEFAQALAGLIRHGEVPRGTFQRVLDSERFGLLRPLPFFEGFAETSLWEVVHRAQWRRYPAGRRLMRHGETTREFHVIVQGEVEVLREGQTVAHLGPGQTVGEMALLAPSPALREHRADVRATQTCVTVVLDPAGLERLGRETRHQLDQAFIGVLVRRLHAAHEALQHPRQIL
ncbi:serine/threonine-protein kinase [Ideonella livida]|uniref:serine/threonine-protein kinase n=1 Tax=Ideonella livida TaxID=2707176 RepID=UPI002873B089|nr:serine/threonine-protein kinase [Ideonella livida]